MTEVSCVGVEDGISCHYMSDRLVNKRGGGIRVRTTWRFENQSGENQRVAIRNLR